MDKKSICSFFYAMMLAILLISCNDEDDYDGLAPAELNGTYSNKLSAPANEDSLILSYNGNTFIGKDFRSYLCADLLMNLPSAQSDIVKNPYFLLLLLVKPFRRQNAPDGRSHSGRCCA